MEKEKIGKFRVVINRIIPRRMSMPLDYVTIIGRTPDGCRMIFNLFEDQITNLPGGSRYNIEPGMEIEVRIFYGEEINCFRKVEAEILNL
jgi:hypothetical protein